MQASLPQSVKQDNEGVLGGVPNMALGLMGDYLVAWLSLHLEAGKNLYSVIVILN